MIKRRWLLIVIAVFLVLGNQVVLAEEEQKGTYSNTIESVIANAQAYKGTCSFLHGYPKIKENGIAFYYTRRDYLYDTNECAIWLPERKDLSLDEFVRKQEVKEGELTYLWVGITRIENVKGYVAEGEYLQSAQEKKYEVAPKMEKRVNVTPGEKVSIYRLLGEPWAYDGCNVMVEGIQDTSQRVFANKQSLDEKGTSLRIVDGESANGDMMVPLWPDGDTYFKKLGDKYGLNEDEYVMLGAINGEKYRVFIQCNFFFQSVRDYEGRPDARVSYQATDMTVHEKDMTAYKKLIAEQRAVR